MEILSTEFLSALLAIVIIDLVLAGDNAIVIALAARNLQPHLRKKAIIWGTFGAIAVRTAMTLVVVWLLKIPGLLLAGGALLVWIAYKLLADNDNSEHNFSPASNFWDAMKTIVVADAVMGLDNVLAVAGAAHGNFLLVVLGLLISIPIVIWGSQIILKYVERFPSIVYIGGGVLAWTAVKMMVSEPLIKDYFNQNQMLTVLAYVVVIGGILGGGFWSNHSKKRARVAGHVVDLAEAQPESAPVVEKLVTQGGATMMKVLLPVDGSSNSLSAARHVVNRFLGNSAMEVHLLHVRAPLSRHIAQFVSKRDRENFHKDEAERALAPARELLNQFGVPHAEHIELGPKAETINRVAQRLRVNQIVMGTARKNSVTRMLEDSVTNKVLEIAQVPVEVVAGRSISKLEQFGIPAGVGAAVAFLLVAAD
jgi:YjbE family integral membrane protein